MIGKIVILILALFGYAFGQEIEFFPHVIIGASKQDPPGSGEFNTFKPRNGPQPLTPEQLRKAYGLSNNNTAGYGKTIAIIDAFGASTLEDDLRIFSAEYNLPDCTISNGCLTKVNQTGGSTLPPDDTISTWGLEAATDVQAVHAIAPGARILYVAAKSPNSNDLFAAVRYASQHANYVSMSWGSPEGSYATIFDESYFKPYASTVGFFASTGDNGSNGGISYPASSKYIVAVGGTSIQLNEEGAILQETGWSGSGGGCSNFIPANEDQKQLPGYSCSNQKSLPDVAALADPASGLLGYYSGDCDNPPSCFHAFGGTSLAVPIWAAMAAVNGLENDIVSQIYSTKIAYRDITLGSNGGYSCTIGIDCVTGQGSWVHR